MDWSALTAADRAELIDAILFGDDWRSLARDIADDYGCSVKADDIDALGKLLCQWVREEE